MRQLLSLFVDNKSNCDDDDDNSVLFAVGMLIIVGEKEIWCWSNLFWSSSATMVAPLMMHDKINRSRRQNQRSESYHKSGAWTSSCKELCHPSKVISPLLYHNMATIVAFLLYIHNIPTATASLLFFWVRFRSFRLQIQIVHSA